MLSKSGLLPVFNVLSAFKTSEIENKQSSDTQFGLVKSFLILDSNSFYVKLSVPETSKLLLKIQLNFSALQMSFSIRMVPSLKTLDNGDLSPEKLPTYCQNAFRFFFNIPNQNWLRLPSVFMQQFGCMISSFFISSHIHISPISN